MRFTQEQIASLFAAHNQRLASLVCVAVIVLLGLSVANTILFALDEMAPPSPGTLPAADPKRATGPKLSTMELFGKAAQAIPQVDAPETTLNLELQGVFIATDGNQSTAIIAEKNRLGEVFKIGARLPGNSVLSAIYPDHVLISRGSRIEKLRFPDASNNAQSNAIRLLPRAPQSANNPTGLSGRRSRAAPAATNQPVQRSAPAAPATVAAPATAATAATASNDAKQLLQDYEQKLKQDPHGTLAEFGLSAVSAEEPTGYRLGAASAQPLLQQAGLQPGDLVLSVNGTPVGNVSRDSALVRQVISA
ncbi:MAG: type II secretion system protein N, partial [Pseudomonadales bacterium]